MGRDLAYLGPVAGMPADSPLGNLGLMSKSWQSYPCAAPIQPTYLTCKRGIITTVPPRRDKVLIHRALS
jgi:hypothetical protein